MSILKGYEYAKEIYAGIGVDTDAAIKALDRFIISLHCWQGDDVGGFESTGGDLTGGIAVTGNYPGKATTPQELRADLSKAMDLIPGKQKANIHASYLENGGKKIDRNEIEPKHFDGWVQWAVENKTGIDFNSTYYSHSYTKDGLSLSSSDASVSDFWIEHGKRCRTIAEYIGKKTNFRSNNNLWIPDGFKDNPVDKLAPRMRLKEALDKVFSQPVDQKYTKDAVECKLFGLGSEAYVVGSHEFYMGYTMSRPNKDVMLTLDSGHFHPTEVISQKISALLLFYDELLLHVSRPVRWDSDHVVILDDELLAIASEVIRCEASNRVNIALDYFDASINRIAAWVIGTRNTQKALLRALLEPTAALMKAEANSDWTSRLALTEEYKMYPFSAIWDYYCEKNSVPVREKWLNEVKTYERDILSKR